MALLETLVAQPPPLRMDADGAVRVGRTRVTLDTVIGDYEDGALPEEIVVHYDSLELADVHAVISFYLRHRSEVDAYLAARRQHAVAVRRESETRWPAAGLRERLLARRRERN
jgi:uncharacterized protein (DUF433 family)